MRKYIYTSFVIITFLCLACTKKEETFTIDQDEITLQHDGTIQLNVSPAQTCTWSTDDNTIATVSQTGLVTGVLIGDTKVSAKSLSDNSTVSCIVHVTPRSTLYVEPYYIYGASISTIKSKEKRSLLSETSTGLIYEGENSNVVDIIYLFDTSGLTGADVMLTNSTSVAAEAVTFIEERYTYLGVSDNIIFYQDSDGTIIAISVVDTLGLNVMYYRSTSKGSNKGIDELQQLKSQFVHTLK